MVSALRTLWSRFASFNASARGERMQRGQALVEYWPTIPASIAILLMASLVTQFIIGSVEKTVSGLTNAGLDCEVQTSEESAGWADTAFFEDAAHTIELVTGVHDSATDTTTVTYKITSVDDKDNKEISHVVFALPPEVYDKLISVDWAYGAVEWGLDPTTGVTGLKLEWDGGGGDEVETEGGGGPPGGGKPKKYPIERFLASTTDSRLVIITLAGYFDWDATTLTAVKAGPYVYTTTIAAPSTPSTPPAGDEC